MSNCRYSYSITGDFNADCSVPSHVITGTTPPHVVETFVLAKKKGSKKKGSNTFSFPSTLKKKKKKKKN
jgi:hypothetical protein